MHSNDLPVGALKAPILNTYGNAKDSFRTARSLRQWRASQHLSSCACSLVEQDMYDLLRKYHSGYKCECLSIIARRSRSLKPCHPSSPSDLMHLDGCRAQSQRGQAIHLKARCWYGTIFNATSALWEESGPKASHVFFAGPFLGLTWLCVTSICTRFLL